MKEKGQDGATSPSMEQRIGGVQRQELLTTALREDDTSFPAISGKREGDGFTGVEERGY